MWRPYEAAAADSLLLVGEDDDNMASPSLPRGTLLNQGRYRIDRELNRECSRAGEGNYSTSFKVTSSPLQPETDGFQIF